MYINFGRRHLEESRVRQEARQDAERIDGYRDKFVEWAHKNRVPQHEIDQGLQQLDDVVANRRRHAERT